MRIIKGLYHNILSLLYSNYYPFLGLILCIYMLYYFSLYKGVSFTFAFALSPLLLIGFFVTVSKPNFIVLLFWSLNYFCMTMGRYIHNLKPGILMLVMSIIVLVYIIVYSIYKKVEWDRIKTPYIYLWILWMAYCSTQLFRKDVVFEAWSISIGIFAFYAICIGIFIPLFFHRYKDLQLILFIWSIFIIIASFKGYWQKNHGFDSRELEWLWSYGYRTHFLRTGIRYFSIFTDAANYGASNGFSLVVYAAAAFFLKNKWARIYFLFIASLSLFGLLISGTRVATFIPFIGFTAFIFLSKHIKTIFTGSILIIAAFCFLTLTTIGDDNRFIKRMRTAFDQEDASLNVRLVNQQKLDAYMSNHPFGVGIGLSAGRWSRWMEKSEIPAIPNDSWWVMIWTETGIVGILFYLIMNAILYGYGGYILLFRVRNNELRGILAAMLSGSLGLFAASYGNELMGFPNGMLSYTALIYVFIAPRMEKEMEEENTALESQKKLDDAKLPA